jgi:hypothetical protein
VCVITGETLAMVIIAYHGLRARLHALARHCNCDALRAPAKGMLGRAEQAARLETDIFQVAAFQARFWATASTFAPTSGRRSSRR